LAVVAHLEGLRADRDPLLERLFAGALELEDDALPDELEDIDRGLAGRLLQVAARVAAELQDLYIAVARGISL
jgi:hypothetical protein